MQSKQYGLPYKGSKNKIANWVIEHLPHKHSDYFIDLFAGGCAMSHAALLSGRYTWVIANDLTDTPAVFKAACLKEFENYAATPDKKEFDEHKHTDRGMAILFSYTTGCSQYLWAEDNETKRLATKVVLGSSVHERKNAFNDFIRYLGKTGGFSKNNDLNKLGKSEVIARLSRIQKLSELNKDSIDQLQPTRFDYRELFFAGVPDSCLIYADPPYKNTDNRGYAAFDYAAFETWLAEMAEKEQPVYVSEYTCPEGCSVVASTKS